MRATPWPEARNQGPISFEVFQLHVARRERFLAKRNRPQEFWQNETNVNVSAAHIDGRSCRGGTSRAGRTTDRLRTDDGKTKLSP
jgi:hypothetical protein